MTATSCPEPQQLQRLVLGQTDDATAAVLERHVEGCAHCSGVLPTLGGDDALVEAMRSAPAVALSPEERSEAERLSHLLRGQSPPRDTTTMDRTHGDAPQAGPVRFDFLAPSQAADEIGRLGAYRVLKILGHGGMGVVFHAEDTQLQRPVALKVMLPGVAEKASARERFQREARLAAKIENDHVVAIHHVAEERGVPFLVMPLLQGESLEDWLRRREVERPAAPADTAEVLRLGREIAQGLAAAHERGLIHRDVKPGNVWLEKVGRDSVADLPRGGDLLSARAKLLDFGLARPVEGDQHLTHSGVIVGTPAYMSPEQARGGAVDGRADLWSLGCVLYRLCTGRMPFQGADLMATLLQAALETPPAPRQLNLAVPPELDDLIRRLLAKDPKDRPASARAVVEELRRLERTYTQDDTVAFGAPVGARRRSRLVVGAAAAALVLLVVGGIVVRIIRKDEKVEVIPLGPGDKVEVVNPVDPGEESAAWEKRVRGLPAARSSRQWLRR